MCVCVFFKESSIQKRPEATRPYTHVRPAVLCVLSLKCRNVTTERSILRSRSTESNIIKAPGVCLDTEQTNKNSLSFGTRNSRGTHGTYGAATSSILIGKFASISKHPVYRTTISHTHPEVRKARFLRETLTFSLSASRIVLTVRPGRRSLSLTICHRNLDAATITDRCGAP